MDAMPAPTPGTGAKAAPVTNANMNIVRCVCIIRASRFCSGVRLVPLPIDFYFRISVQTRANWRWSPAADGFQD